jgi:uncharacterized protein YegJ (DUF2314 family)
MKESPHNIGYVCPDHAPKPKPVFLTISPEKFIGQCVKLAFKVEPGNGPSLEHMWVQVRALYDAGPEELQGVLDNDPRYPVGYKYGDWVAFNRNEIEEVLDG